jgi:hypothetical protein
MVVACDSARNLRRTPEHGVDTCLVLLHSVAEGHTYRKMRGRRSNRYDSEEGAGDTYFERRIRPLGMQGMRTAPLVDLERDGRALPVGGIHAGGGGREVRGG